MIRGRLLPVLAIALLAAPAGADVRAGADAWKRGDYADAIAEWRKPAERGDADAQFNLGQAYKLGRGVAADQGKAIDWFRKAAAQNHVPAQDNYGLALYQTGRKAEAAPWLERSVARDEKRAELVLGTMLFNGDAVTRDWARAYALVTRSSRQGLTQATSALAVMDRHIPEAQRRDGTTMAQQIAARRRPTIVATATTVTSAPPVAAAPARAASGAVEGRAATAGVATAGTATAGPMLGATAGTRQRAGVPAPNAVVLPARPPAPSAAPAIAGTPAARSAPMPTPVPPSPTVAATAVAGQPAATRAAPTGSWRVQLGAFRDPGNARTLWQKIGAQVGGRADYVEANRLTRLQATGFASKADAQRACEKAGGGCVVLAP